MPIGRKNGKRGTRESYEDTIEKAEKLTEEERMQLARKVLLVAVESAQAKK
jgi:hypothetical protein